MFSTSIRFVLSASIAVAALALTVPAQVQAAPNNGYGIVYHVSDCGRGNVRQYGAGGRWAGSACGSWVAMLWYPGVWEAMWDHNYTYDELCALAEGVSTTTRGGAVFKCTTT